jgi:hypothetical protein
MSDMRATGCQKWGEKIKLKRAFEMAAKERSRRRHGYGGQEEHKEKRLGGCGWLDLFARWVAEFALDHRLG